MPGDDGDAGFGGDRAHPVGPRTVERLGDRAERHAEAAHGGLGERPRSAPRLRGRGADLLLDETEVVRRLRRGHDLGERDAHRYLRLVDAVLYTYCMPAYRVSRGAIAPTTTCAETVLVDPAVQGTFLNEVELATRIGVSRTPVREALLLLVADGLVEMVPKRGAYVPADVRSADQGADGAARRAGTARGQPRTGRGRGPARRAARGSGRAGERCRPSRRRPAPRRRSSTGLALPPDLVDAAGNELLARTYAGLRARQMRVGVAALFRADGPAARGVCVEHERIVDALAAGDERPAPRGRSTTTWRSRCGCCCEA